jgi:colanic acid/amylovoran biosynthesis protein
MDKKMKIQIDGTNTLNKGAELMLYAVLQEIERRYPDAEVIFNRFKAKTDNIKTHLHFRTRPFYKIITLLHKCKVHSILRILGIPCSLITCQHPLPNIDIVMDAGGFQFSDQWNITNYKLQLWEKYYRKLKQQGTKIILLPQAFGPFESVNGKKIVEIISEYTDIIFARETVSYNHLIYAGADRDKIKLYPDFTALVEGICPGQYESLKGGVCLVPNMRMIDKGIISEKNYCYLFSQIIDLIRRKGKNPFFLNHEGQKDSLLCDLINKSIDIPLTIVDGLTALEVKGVISQSYLLISSRFHGIASALNSGVPCLATSWSHKYEELFKDYEQTGCLLDLNNINTALEKIEDYLSEQTHKRISEELKIIKPSILQKNREMWNIVWDYCLSFNSSTQL